MWQFLSKNKAPLQLIVWGVLWLMIWQGFSSVVASTLLLPSPIMVFRRLFALMFEQSFYATLFYSITRIGIGVLLGSISGTLMGIATAYSHHFQALFALPLSAISSAPVASFVILALIWIPSRFLSTFIAFLMVLPIFARQIHQGIKGVDQDILEMAKVFNLPFRRKIQNIYLPFLRTSLQTATALSISMGWKAGIAGEVLAIPHGSVGTALYNAKVYLETTDLFAWTLVIILCSLLLERIAITLLKGRSS